jgi:tRNA threonylcarbamoyl adenosine modification protein YeaZ
MLLKNEELLIKRVRSAFRKQNNYFSGLVKEIITKANLHLSEIKIIYLIVGPGSFTGIKVGLTFVNTLLSVSFGLKVYTLNSLAFQSNGQTVISALTMNEREKYVAVYQQGSILEAPQLVNNDQLVRLKQKYKNFIYQLDYQHLNPYNAFINTKSLFELSESETVEGTYLKNVV